MARLLTFVLLAVFFLAMAAAKCPNACTDDYTPVCGRNRNGELKTFSNLCELNIAECENPTSGWFRLKDGACMETRAAKCNHICTTDYTPVCGRNRNGELKTFSNLCMFNSVQCENPAGGWFILRDGACIETKKTNCNHACTDDYTPVCGKNKNGELKTFSNLCEFNIAKCENPTSGWFTLKDAACMETRDAKCNHICTTDYTPVCGRNRNGELKTFSNLCMFNSVQCENPAGGWFILRDGACIETKKTNCNHACTDDYTPVCGKNKNGELKTFSNLCEFNIAKCENPTSGWFTLKDAACMETRDAKCNHICTTDYTPVCGRNRNGELKTFSNLCMFNSVQCENPAGGWFILRDGACIETKKTNCNHACTDDYTPVCGKNKNGELKTFSNLCEFNIAKCENPTSGWFTLKDAACMETRDAKCNHICTTDYTPVCGRNRNGELKTFSNLCMFNSVQCENPAGGWFILRDGACIETKKTNCNHACTDDYTPVCGKNKNGELKTFSNLCEFNIAKCENPTSGWFTLKDAACMETRDAKCNHICTTDYTPVCGRNRNGELKTFSNLCMFNSVQCENPAGGWFILRDGACIETKKTNCNHACTDDYTPVCGKNKNGELKTFSNLCEFNIAKCENPTSGWFTLKDAACMETRDAKCNHICTTDYTPVCGRNRNGELKTFSNLCMFNSVQCENPAGGWFILRDGACIETKKTNCNHACTDDYTPVCGKNKNGELKTFSNLCEFNIAKCENPTSGWFTLKDAACMETRADKCNHGCTEDYTPVCGRNRNGELKTFSNLCEFNIAECEEPFASWFRIRDGACE